ncbi:ATP-binding protein [Lysinibacillus xylanilyticus]|uniref:ATP-binding protein n=1 Tax=Lysinibacillus xylanilyticus TaxID=582475 RepID=UPI0037FCA8B6
MTIDLLAIQPHQISRDLREKIVVIYGEPKVGKTTIASQFPKALLLAFEKGYNALAGVMAQNVTKWAEFKKVLKQLENKAVQEKFETIVVDTADLSYASCEKFILQREGVDKIGDIPYGGGYKLVRDEFDTSLRSIPMMGYGLVMVSHAQVQTVSAEDGTEYSKTVPTLAKQPRGIVLSMADIIGYAKSIEREGESRTVLFLRGTPQFEAGSRFKHTPPVIKFEYDSLVKAIAEAIEKEEQEKGQTEIVETNSNAFEVETISFEDLKAEIKDLTAELIKVQGADTAKKTMKDLVETHLGKGRTLKDVTELQAEQLSLVAYDLREMLKIA